MDQRRRRRARLRRSQAKRRRQRNIILKVIFACLFIVGVIAALILWKRYGATKEKMDLDKYYGIQNENQLAVVVNNGILEPSGMLSDGKVYVEYSLVRDYINERFYWDPNENILRYSLPNDIVSVGVGEKEYSVSKTKNTVDYVILKTEGESAYIALDYVKQYTDMDYEVFDHPSRVVVSTETGTIQVAKASKDTQVRYQGGVKSPILKEIQDNEELVLIEDEGGWKKVRTQDGFIGYVKKSALKKQEAKTIDRGFEELEYSSIKKDYKINLTWHNVANSEANTSVLEMIAQTKGLTTLSPTWFHVADVSGNVSSIASADYVNYAHQSNIEVWGAVRDFDGGINSPEETYELLSHTSARENLTNQLVATALQIGMDGINVDFEKISVECGVHYIQFIRELSVKCRQNGIVLSVDNYVPQPYNVHYNRKEQAVFADYVIVMCYDEHYAGSLESGSVASYNYVKDGIEQTIKDVPKEKVICAIPFFTRLWKETPKSQEELNQQAGTEEEQYDMNVSSEAYGMADAEAIVAQAGATPAWDEETKQNFASWEMDGAVYKIWLEDEASIEAKLGLIKESKIAGCASWRLGYEKSEIWDLLIKYMK